MTEGEGVEMTITGENSYTIKLLITETQSHEAEVMRSNRAGEKFFFSPAP